MEGILLGVAAVITATAAWRKSGRAEQGHQDVRDQIATNHGKRPGEYLEMVADIRDSQEAMTSEMSALARLIAEHTVQDAHNFAELRKLLAGKVDK